MRCGAGPRRHDESDAACLAQAHVALDLVEVPTLPQLAKSLVKRLSARSGDTTSGDPVASEAPTLRVLQSQTRLNTQAVEALIEATWPVVPCTNSQPNSASTAAPSAPTFTVAVSR